MFWSYGCDDDDYDSDDDDNDNKERRHLSQLRVVYMRDLFTTCFGPKGHLQIIRTSDSLHTI